MPMAYVKPEACTSSEAAPAAPAVPTLPRKLTVVEPSATGLALPVSIRTMATLTDLRLATAIVAATGGDHDRTRRAGQRGARLDRGLDRERRVRLGDGVADRTEQGERALVGSRGRALDAGEHAARGRDEVVVVVGVDRDGPARGRQPGSGADLGAHGRVVVGRGPHLDDGDAERRRRARRRRRRSTPSWSASTVMRAGRRGDLRELPDDRLDRGALVRLDRGHGGAEAQGRGS